MTNASKATALVLLMLFSLLNAQALEVAGRQQSEPVCNADRSLNWTVGLIQCNNNISLGYTLFSPMPTDTAYLIDTDGRQIHSWTSPGNHRPALSAYLMDDGSLLRTANIVQTAAGDFSGGGTGGKVERIAWDGSLMWSYEYSSSTYISHHDIEPLPNGNILMIAWEAKTDAEAEQAGRNPAIASDAPGGSNGVWPDKIVEIRPNGTNGGDEVWSWQAWDHLVQDYDSSKANFGVVADHPELLDINFIDASGAQAGKADWMHCNGIDYNPSLDQIAISCKNMNEIYIIDHSTTTQQAAGHAGGNSGKGGDFLYRWGNPEAYDAGSGQDQQLFGQHDVQWIEQGREGFGSLILFNNGVNRAGTFSSVDVITPMITNGAYQMDENNRFFPSAPAWSWDQGSEMYSSAISGVERLPNNNTLVTHGNQGTIYEVSLDGEIVWTYVNPVSKDGTVEQGETIPDGNQANTKGNPVFRARRVTADHPAFENRDITPGDYIEPWTDACPDTEALPWDRNGDGCIDDSDQDGVLDPTDVCPGHDDTVDVDGDGVPDGCDSMVDSDTDGITDSMDACEGFDDAVDVDQDGTPDGCDGLIDSDGDQISDAQDACEGFDDRVDDDNDGIPDGCDPFVGIILTPDYFVHTQLGQPGHLNVTLEAQSINLEQAFTIQYEILYEVIPNNGNNLTKVSAGELDMVQGQRDFNQSFELQLSNGPGTYCVLMVLEGEDGNRIQSSQNNSATDGCTEVNAAHWASKNTTNLHNQSDTNGLNETQEQTLAPEGAAMNSTGYAGVLMIFSGVWIGLYLLFQMLRKPEQEAPHEDHFVEGGAKDFTPSFNTVAPMIQLPEPTPLAAPPSPVTPTTPPLPASGLPEGWTMEQWTYYGQQWIDAHQ